MTRITGMLIAGIGFGGAVTVFGVAVVDAMRIETAPQVAATAEAPNTAAPIAAPAVTPSDPRAGEVRDPEFAPPGGAAPGRATLGLEARLAESTSPRLPRAELERAVNQDPFQPDRRAPARRYVLPGQRVIVTEVETERPEAPSFRVVGAARIGQGGLVLVQVDDGDLPIAVSVGESIEGYRVESVTDEGATLTAEGGSWALAVVEPREERPSRNNRSNNNRGRNTRQQAAEVDVAGQIEQLLQSGLQGILGTQGRGGLIFGGRAGRAGGGDAANFVIRARRGGGGGGQ
ncbi:MAG: hypothetical protein O6851_01980 [Gemmatimonadetes bacterium]|nr:hypothetical protein [Gemmatimonadota bacterium]